VGKRALIRWAKALSSPTAPRCLRTARYGETMRDLQEEAASLGGTGVRDYKRETKMASKRGSVVDG